MPIPAIIEEGYLRLTDAIFDRMHRPLPSREELQGCKIISHRGDHDNNLVIENTIPAFERAAKAGTWGIEFDIRWTRDLEPVVFHDADLLRLYGVRKNVSDFSLNELLQQYPAIPALSEVIDRFGKKCHLMIEIKIAPWLDRTRQVHHLERILSPLAPLADFHLITCHKEMLIPFNNISAQAKIAIAQNIPEKLSRWVKRQGWGGLCGHYLLLGAKTVNAHHSQGQKIGTGFIQSRNTLFREASRGVDWLFSNNAVHLQKILDDCRSMASSG